MRLEKIKQELREIIKTNIYKPTSLTDDDNVLKTLDVDSLDRVELIMAIESTFLIDIDDGVAMEHLTINKMANFLKEQGCEL